MPDDSHANSGPLKLILELAAARSRIEQATTCPLDPALRTGSTPPTGNDVDIQIMN